MNDIIYYILVTLFCGGLMLYHYISKKKLEAKEIIVHVTVLESSDDEEVSIPSDPESIANYFSQPIGGLLARVWDFSGLFLPFIVCEKERHTFVKHLHDIDHSQNWYYNIGKIFKALKRCPSTDWKLVVAFNSAQLKMFLEVIKNSDEEHPASPNACVWYAFSSILDTMLINAGYKEK